MSTLAAARADNMYYPPEWRPEMGGISKFQGSKGHNQYEQYGKIRFELPSHGWCLSCGRHIGRGTRFNATKDQAGTYFSTKIWQFTMKCPSCSNLLVIKTDPKNTDYEYVEGIRKKDMAFDPEEAETARVQDSEVSNKLAVDPLFRLEHQQDDRRRAATRKTALTRLTELSEINTRDDYATNSLLRKGMRVRKRRDREKEEEATARGLGIPLASPSPADDKAARGVKYRTRHQGFRTAEKSKMAAIAGESIFGCHRESSDRARRKALLVKAAKLGIKTKALRLLEPDDLEAPRRRPAAPGRSTAPELASAGSYLDHDKGARTDGRKKQTRVVKGGVGGGAHIAAGVPVPEASAKRKRHSGVDGDHRSVREERRLARHHPGGRRVEANVDAHEVLEKGQSESDALQNGRESGELAAPRRKEDRVRVPFTRTNAPSTSVSSQAGLAAIASLY